MDLLKKRYVKLPSEVGCIVSNATSALAVGNALQNGMPITTKIVTVSGDGVVKPQNVLAYVGTPIKELVDACGGYKGDDIVLPSWYSFLPRGQQEELRRYLRYARSYVLQKCKDEEVEKYLREMKRE